MNLPQTSVFRLPFVTKWKSFRPLLFFIFQFSVFRFPFVTKWKSFRPLLFFIFQFSIFSFQFTEAFGQGQTGNLGQFDRRLLHYGIQVGYTQSKFDLHYNEDPELRETLQG